MLKEKINQLTNTPIYNKIKNFLLEDNHYMNIFWISCAFIFMSMFSLPSLISFTLFVFTVRSFNNTNSNYLKKLLKFWCFSFLFNEGHKCLSYLVPNNTSIKLIEFMMAYYLLINSREWFEGNNLSNDNSEESVFFIENMIQRVKQLYQINYLSLDFYIEYVVFLSRKYYLIKSYIDNSRKYIMDKFEKKENQKVEKVNDIMEESSTGESKEELVAENEIINEKLPESDSDSDSEAKSANNIISKNDDQIIEEALKETFGESKDDKPSDGIDEIDDDGFLIKSN